MVTRNQIYDALLALGLTAWPFVDSGRRLKLFDTSEKPALYQIEPAENYGTAGGQLRHRKLKVTWVIYHSAGSDPNAVPARETSDIIDAIDALFPDAIGPIRQTLGGLVYSVVIDGVVQKFEGDLDNQTVISVPLTITIP